MEPQIFDLESISIAVGKTIGGHSTPKNIYRDSISDFNRFQGFEDRGRCTGFGSSPGPVTTASAVDPSCKVHIHDRRGSWQLDLQQIKQNCRELQGNDRQMACFQYLVFGNQKEPDRSCKI